MYLRRIIILRPNTSAEFFYIANNVLTNTAYMNMVNQATGAGEMVSESLTISPNTLELVRETVWNTETDFNNFFALYQANIFPDYILEFDSYNTINEHFATLETETI